MSTCPVIKRENTHTKSSSMLVSTYQDQIKELTREVKEIVQNSKTLIAKSAKK